MSRPSTVIRHARGPEFIDPKGEQFISTDDQKRDIVLYVAFDKMCLADCIVTARQDILW